MNEFMDTVDPRLDPPRNRPVHMPTYRRRGRLWIAAVLYVVLVAAIAVFA